MTLLPLLPRIVLMAGAVLMSGAARASPAPDAWITTRAKLVLFTGNIANATVVHVDTVNGRVFLSGQVASAALKGKAGGSVRRIDGVTSVSNMLEVVRPASAAQAGASDEAVRDEVSRQLIADPSLTFAQVVVKSVKAGAVGLSGVARNLSEQLSAVQTAYRVAGVRSVTSDVKSSQGITALATTPTQAQLTESARNAWVVAASRLRLLADQLVPALEIGLDASGNVVTLFGIVSSDEEKAAAGLDVQGADQQVTVKNELRVVPGALKRLAVANDDVVQQAVEKALASRDGLKAVVVKVTNGVVRLTGTVDSGWERLCAGVVTRGTAGVRAVQDDLEV